MDMCSNDQIRDEVRSLKKDIEVRQGTYATLLTEVRDHMKEQVMATNRNTDILDIHNGRLTKTEMFLERVKGATMATKAVWSVLGIFVITSSFGLFQMYIAFQKLPYTIDQAIDKALDNKVFEYEEN